jgi:hypothetical protein
MSGSATLLMFHVIVHHNPCEEVVFIYEFCMSEDTNKRFISFFREAPRAMSSVQAKLLSLAGGPKVKPSDTVNDRSSSSQSRSRSRSHSRSRSTKRPVSRKRSSSREASKSPSPSRSDVIFVLPTLLAC